MDEPGCMGRREAVGDLHGEIQQLPRILRRSDRRPFDVFEHQIIRTDVVELADVGMVERGNSSRLAYKALAESLVRDLDRHDAIEPCVAGTIHLAHAADADRSSNLIRADRGA